MSRFVRWLNVRVSQRNNKLDPMNNRITDQAGNPCSPFAYALSRIHFSACFTIRPTDEENPFAVLSGNGEQLRQDRVRRFMNSLRCHLSLRGRDWFWVATSEQGFTKVGHIHLLIALDPKVRTMNPIASAKELNGALRKLLPQVFPMPHFTNDIGFLDDKSDQSEVISYFTKLENQKEKDFFFSREGRRELFNVNKFQTREAIPLYTRDWDSTTEDFIYTPVSASAQ